MSEGAFLPFLDQVLKRIYSEKFVQNDNIFYLIIELNKEILPFGVFDSPQMKTCLFVKSSFKTEEIKDELPSNCEIITFNQLKTEYSTFEARRCLCSRFDLFLAEESASRHLPKLIGKKFYMTKKVPIPISIHPSNAVEKLSKALSSAFFIRKREKRYRISIGNIFHDQEQVFKNVVACVHSISKYCIENDATIDLIELQNKSLRIPIFINRCQENSSSETITTTDN